MTVKGRKGPEEFKVDEHPKPDSTIEQLAKLAPVFKKDGTITAANASVSYFHCTFVFVYIYVCCFPLEQKDCLDYFTFSRKYPLW